MKSWIYQNENTKNLKKASAFAEEHYKLSGKNKAKKLSRLLDVSPENIEILGIDWLGLYPNNSIAIDFTSKNTETLELFKETCTEAEYELLNDIKRVVLRADKVADYLAESGVRLQVTEYNNSDIGDIEEIEVGALDQYYLGEGVEPLTLLALSCKELDYDVWVSVLERFVPISNFPIKMVEKVSFKNSLICLNFVTCKGERKYVEYAEQFCMQFVGRDISIHDNIANIEDAMKNGFVKKKDFLPLCQMSQAKKVLTHRKNIEKFLGTRKGMNYGKSLVENQTVGAAS